jgi:hypothetical protein
VVHGKDETVAQAVAEQSVSALPGVTLKGRIDVPYALIVNLSITLLSKAKSDDVLVRRILEKFKDYPELKVELKNEPHADGSLRKKIFVNGRAEVLLDLKDREQIEDFEENGLGDQYMDVLYKRLEGILRKPVKPEILISEVTEEVEEAGNNNSQKEEKKKDITIKSRTAFKDLAGSRKTALDSIEKEDGNPINDDAPRDVPEKSRTPPNHPPAAPR